MTETRGTTAADSRRPAAGRGPTTRMRALAARVSLFYRQVVAELRKVIWPTRRELVTYTSVVGVFVVVMLAVVAAIDFAFGELVLFVFGG